MDIDFCRTIPGEGPKDCIMALVGEAPGSTEIALGRPFVGGAGNVLNTKLHLSGIARQRCYITNIIKYKLPDNDFSKLWRGKTPLPELVNARDSLLQELDELNTNVIVALGNNPMWALTGKTGIKKWRGSVLQCALPSGRVVKVIPTYHPAAVLREWELGAQLGFDLKKAARESTTPHITITDRHLIIAPTITDIYSFVEQSTSTGALAFDIETSPSSITCISFSFSPDIAISIPTTEYYWGSFSALREVLHIIDDLLRTPNVVKIGHNMTFDIQYLWRFFGILPSKPWFDTMIAHHSCYSELPKALSFLTSIYTNEPYYKDDLKVWQTGSTTDDVLWMYNAKDSAITLECYYALKQRMDLLETRGTFDYMMQLLEPLLFMMLNGMNICWDTVKDHKKCYLKKLTEKEGLFSSKYGDINPYSPKQVSLLAYDTLGLKPIMKDGKVTTDKKALDKLATKSPDIASVADIRHERKMISTYLEFDVDKVDGKFRFSLNSTGTETGRLSSSKSVFDCGYNIQNIPKNLRDIFIPTKGMMFTQADLKGAEAMFVAYDSDDPVLIKLIEENKNIHTFTAFLIWGADEEHVKMDKAYYDSIGRDTESMYFRAKKVRHSGNYMGSWVTLSEQLKIPAAEAKTLLNKFLDNSPNLRKWHQKIITKVKSTGVLTTPLGRKRLFFGRLGDKLFREAIAYRPQETVAHVLNLGIINVYNGLCKEHHDISIVNQVHDSMLIQHPVSKADLVAEALPKLMRVDLCVNNHNFFIPIELEQGFDWYNMEEVR